MADKVNNTRDEFIGLKLVTRYYQSLSTSYAVVNYPKEIGGRVTAPGHGIFLAVSAGLLSGGDGDVLIALRGFEATGKPAPAGVVCVRHAERIAMPDLSVFTEGIGRCIAQSRSLTDPETQRTLAADKRGGGTVP